ncbi:unnamed protein product [Prunus armeniaca]
MGVASSSAKIKRLVSANSKKINGMQEVQDILLRNNASPCCPLEHEDGKQLYPDLPLAQSEQSNVVDAKAVEDQIADEAAMEEDNSQGGVADEARPDVKEQAGEAIE